MGDLGLQFMERIAEEGLDTPKTQAEPAARNAEHIATFARITRCVRETFAMEQRLAAGKHPDAPREPSASANDPRRPMIKNFLLEHIGASPNPKSVKAGFRNQLDTLITEHLEADPEQDDPPARIILDISKELGLTCTPSDMPDELLKRLHRSMTEEEKAAVAGIVHRRIYGHDPP